ncbi:MAG: helix-turn-helix transcriptional regulator [Dehalococcoidia bacterium]|nr:helix-turn-helix transcriptional regulator [Dehalococcoidia bacterium]
MSKSRIKDIEKYADIFKALSNPHRLKIFMRLACCGPEGMECCSAGRVCECVGTLGSMLGIAPSTVSHHLKELYRAGLIKMSRNGQRIDCSVAPETIESLADFFKPAVIG